MAQPDQVHDTPPLYRALVNRWGPPLSVESARRHWNELVAATESGVLTLIARDTPSPRWVALVPLTEVSNPLTECTVWPISSAQTRLTELLNATTREPAGHTQLLSSWSTLVAALIPAAVLACRPPVRIDAGELLRDGGTLTLAFYPAVDGQIDQEGNVVTEPENEAFVITAVTPDGAEVGIGAGPTIAEAIIRLTHHQPPAPPPGWTTHPRGPAPWR